jgi:adenylate cyclase
MKIIGLGRWPGNPKYCRGCFRELYRRRAGAEVECSLVFADVRDSTPLAEALGPTEFRRRMDQFYAAAFDALVSRDAFVDKFVGDEVIGIFIPALTDGHHARQALIAAVDVLHATGHATGDPWLPIGVGVNSGVAYVGAVGTADHVEFTALGDPVNVAARLAGAAGAGEVLATVATLRAAAWPDAQLEHRQAKLKGKADAVNVAVLTASATLPA